jgi:hypothetical protein
MIRSKTIKIIKRYPHTCPIIHIRKTQASEWLQAQFLALRAGYLCVDEGSGPIWIPFEAEYIHPDDWARLQDKENQPL